MLAQNANNLLFRKPGSFQLSVLQKAGQMTSNAGNSQSQVNVRRQPAPVSTSSRRTGLVIALPTVSILILPALVDRKVADQGICRKVGSGRRLRTSFQ